MAQAVKRRQWYAISSDGSQAEISIFDEIGGWWGVSVAEFKEDFDAVRDSAEVRLLLNSPGGIVTDAMAIYNLLASIRSKLTVEVLGIAASAASVVALAGRELVMGEGTYLMIHEPWSWAIGSAEDMRREANVLDKMSGEMARIYCAHCDLDEGEVREKMAAETWFTASEAVDAGFADRVAEDGEVAALAFDLRRFQHVPAAVLQLAAAQRTNTGKTPGAERASEITREGTVTHEEIMKAYGELSDEDRSRLAGEWGLVPLAQTDQLEGRIQVLEKANTQMADVEKQRLEAERAERKATAIGAALEDGRIRPAHREFWEGRFDADADGTAEVLDRMPKSLLIQEIGTDYAGDPDDLSAHEQAALAGMGYAAEQIGERAQLNGRGK